MLAYRQEQSAHGQVRVSNELRKRGTFVRPSGVRSICLRHDRANFKQRLCALEQHVAQRRGADLSAGGGAGEEAWR